MTFERDGFSLAYPNQRQWRCNQNPQTMIELPPLPPPLKEARYMQRLAEAWAHGEPAPLRVYQQIFEQEIATQMRSYGEACAIAALEAAAKVAENTYEGSNANAHFSAAAIRAMMATSPS